MSRTKPRFRRVVDIVQNYLGRFQKSIGLTEPIVSYERQPYSLKLPLSHALPGILQSYPYYNDNLARLSGYLSRRYQDLTIIDVGGNVGDTVQLLRSVTQVPILTVEGEPYFFDLLCQNVQGLSRISTHRCFLSAEPATLTASMKRSLGTAQLSRDGLVGAAEIQVTSLDALLDLNPEFRQAKLLKIDTDGFDYQVLRGSVRLLTDCHPVLFFEYDPEHLRSEPRSGFDLFNSLLGWEYREVFVYDNTGRPLARVSLEKNELLADLHSYACGRRNTFYYDLVAIPEWFGKHSGDFWSLERQWAAKTFDYVYPLREQIG